MYDREMAQHVLERLSPEFRAMVSREARSRGVSACDVALETALMVAQAQTAEALYALKESQARPALRSV